MLLLWWWYRQQCSSVLSLRNLLLIVHTLSLCYVLATLFLCLSLYSCILTPSQLTYFHTRLSSFFLLLLGWELSLFHIYSNHDRSHCVPFCFCLFCTCTLSYLDTNLSQYHLDGMATYQTFSRWCHQISTSVEIDCRINKKEFGLWVWIMICIPLL